MTEHSGEARQWPAGIEKWMDWIPARLRRGRAVVPVVRLSGVIGAVTPLRPGMSLAGVGGGVEGVVGGSFGFQELIKKIGVERRLYTAGAHKAMLDPFLPENPEDVSRLKALQREIHDIFIALVKGSRGARLKGADELLFTGEYWAGETSVSLGLADAIGDLRSTLRARYGEKVQTPLIAPSSGMLSGLLGRRSPGAISAWENTANLPEEVISALESRAIWAKFGF